MSGSGSRTIAVITGTRAEYGLLRPVMKAIQDHADLTLQVVATGTHLLEPVSTIKEIERDFSIAATIPMQTQTEGSRLADAAALGRGVSGFAEYFASSAPDIVLVLGDRIEPFAAVAAAQVAGIHIAHMHGGDRAEGVSDEALRHAMTKLSHIHLPATVQSGQRIIAMGERPDSVHVVGSPALDGLDRIPPLDDQHYAGLGQPKIVVLFHPTGRPDKEERDATTQLIECCTDLGPTLALHPNYDPGRDGVLQALCESSSNNLTQCPHLPRVEFIGLLRRAAVLVGNSSAGLIECSALGIPSINLGDRQSGRERGESVVSLSGTDNPTLSHAVSNALTNLPRTVSHPFGDGQTGIRTAALLATIDLSQYPLRKQNSY